MKQFKQYKYYKFLYTSVMIIFATLLQTFTVQAIVTPANLLPAGFLGISVFIQNITQSIIPGGIPLYISTLLLNLPVALLCYRGLNKRFAVFSIVQVLLSSLFLRVFDFEPIIHNPMLAVVIGGALNGMYVALALNGNASTGGTDFIAMYVSNKKGTSIWEYVFIGNAILILLFGFVTSWEAAAFSLLYQFIATKTIDSFYHRYEMLTVQITSENPEKIMDFYFTHYKHGMTCIEGVGGYTHRKVYLLNTVVSAYEIKDMTNGILKTDPTAIINVFRTEQFHGRFHRDDLG